MGKAWHNDEPLYLAPAPHILQDPLHPFDFSFNWFGAAHPYYELNNTPPILFYLLALAQGLTGGGELPMRLCFLPLDLLAALSLYLLAARFLSRPLLPVLIVIATPAWLINMNYLMPEKPAMALGLAGLYALVVGVDERRAGWYWGSAALLGGAVLSKYNAVVFMLAGAGYAASRGVPPGRIIAHAAGALSGLAAWFAWDALTHRAAAGAAWTATSDAWSLPTAGLAHKLRSILAFTGGCGVVTAVWPLLAQRPRGRAPLVALAAVCALFLPGLDVAPLVRLTDRLTGIVLSLGAAWGIWAALRGTGGRGASLWRPWTAAVLVLVCLYWSVVTRMILFMMPPLVFGAAERLESRPWAGRLYGVSLAGVLALSLSLAVVDYRYAAAQKEFAGELATEYIGRGRKVWYTGYMGLQYYLDKAGASGLDASRGGWRLAKPGDAVAVLKINSARLRPAKPVRSDVRSYVVDHPIPLRLISGWTGEGGFYSNVWGFLPFSLSREPLEEFTVVEVR